MNKRMALICVASLAAFSLVFSPAAAQAGDPPPGEPHPIKTTEEAELADAELIAKMQGVTTDIALARIKLQKPIGDLSASLQEQSSIAFGGLWVVNDQDAVLHIALKNLPGTKETDNLNNVKDQVRAKLQGIAGIDRIEYHIVAFSLDELYRIQTLLTDTTARNKWSLVSYIDTTTNSIHVSGTKETLARVNDGFDKSQLPIPVDEDAGRSIFTFVETPQPPDVKQATQVYGGLTMTGSGCTSGFAIAWGDGTIDKRRLLTAAHCADANSVNAVPLDWKGAYYGGFYDFQWHAATNVPTNYVRNLVWNGSFDRVMLAQMNVANMYIGQAACYYGITTGYHCNTITALALAFSIGGTGFGGMIGSSPTTVQGGDSGGPYMNGGTAFGVTIAYWTPQNMDIYMPIERIAVQGLYILTYYTP